MQIKFDGVRGYTTYARAVRRGEEVSELLKNRMTGGLPPRFVVVPVSNPGTGDAHRFAPAFYCGDVQGGPSLFIGLTNVCCFN